jgi:uncharacterized repeat protein (TIGR01451 family)
MSRYISFAIAFFVLGIFLWSENSSAVGEIIVQKTTDPSGFDNFDFLLVRPADPDQPFMLDDGESEPFNELPMGTYTVTETDPATGFELTGIVCNSQEDTSTFVVDLETDSVEITLADLDTVICVFTNTGTVSITIEKVTSPEGGTMFDFTSEIPDGEEFTLDDGESITFNVPPGSYDVTEAVLAGYIVSDIACDDMGSTTNIVTRTATIDADAGEEITCTFTNQQVVTGLNLFKTDTPDPVLAGEELTYEIIIDHQGDIEASNVVLTDTLPPGVILVDVFASDPGVDCSGSNSVTVVCNVGILSADEEIVITVIVIPDPDVYSVAPQIIENVAVLTAEPGPVEIEAATMTQVNPIVNLDLISNNDERRVSKGNSFDVEWEISVSADQVAALEKLRKSSLTPVQKADALGVILDITFPAVFEVLSVETTQGVCDSSIECLIGDILEGQTVVVIVTFKAPDERGEFNINAVVTTLGQTFTNVILVIVENKNDGCSLASAAGPASIPLYLLIPVLIPLRRIWKRFINSRDGSAG